MVVFKKLSDKLPTVPLTYTTEEGKELELPIKAPEKEQPEIIVVEPTEIGFFQTIWAKEHLVAVAVFKEAIGQALALLGAESSGLRDALVNLRDSIFQFLDVIASIAKEREELRYEFEGLVPFWPTEWENIEALREKVSKAVKQVVDEFDRLLSNDSTKVGAAYILVNFMNELYKNETVLKILRTSFTMYTGKEVKGPTFKPIFVDLAPLSILYNRAKQILEENKEKISTVEQTLESEKELIEEVKRAPEKYRPLSPEEISYSVEKLRKKWSTKKGELKKLAEFARQKYNDYVFWKYVDRYINKLASLDLENNPYAIEELLSKNSSISDLIYKNLFIQLFNEFLKNEL
jgi:gas vesicle protein